MYFAFIPLARWMKNAGGDTLTGLDRPRHRVARQRKIRIVVLASATPEDERSFG
jgi:hypothetical protein